MWFRVANLEEIQDERGERRKESERKQGSTSKTDHTVHHNDPHMSWYTVR
jgi:hypothetical protein